MPAVKFLLLLEILKSRIYPDGSPRVVSNSPHVPVKLSNAGGRSARHRSPGTRRAR